MYGDIQTAELNWKEAEWDRTEVDKKVSNTDCFLYAAHLTANTGGAATTIIRDGHDTNGDKVIDLAALTSSADIRRFDPPLFLKKGLFVDVGSNVASVTVHYRPYRKRQEQR